MSHRGLPHGARISTFTGLSLRTLRARPLRSGLTAGAIVLGVGMVFGVLLLVGTIHSTSGKLYDSIYGRTDVVVSGKNSAGALTEGTIDRVRVVKGVQSAAGDIFSIFRTVDARGSVQRKRSDQLYVVGVDYAQPDSSDSKQVAGRNPATGGGEIEIDSNWAAAHGVTVGDRLPFSTPTGVVALRVSGIYQFGGGLDLGGYGTASMPVQDARRIMDKPAVWDEINVVVRPSASAADVRARLQRRLGPGVEVATPKAKEDEAQKQLASLDVILYFFSGIALFVGAFLILNSFNMSVLQRMREIGTLRALGASNRRIAGSIVAEGLVLGLVGSVAGLGLGAVLAVAMLKAMQGFGLPVATVHYTPIAAVAAIVTGLVATLAGCVWPAVRATRVPPVRAMLGDAGPQRGMPPRRRALIGAALFVPGMAVGGLFWFGDTAQGGLLGAVGGIGSTMIMFLGMVLLAPFVILPLVRVMALVLRRLMPAEGRLAADAAQANPSRTAATASTLLIALSVVVVNATVASSFVGTLRDQLDHQYARDLTVQPLDYQDYGPPQSGISRRLREQIAAMPEAAAVARRRVLYLQKMPGGSRDGLMVGYDPYEYDRVDRLDYQGAPRAQILRGLADGGVVPSKVYAKGHDLHVGDRLRLEGPSGVRMAPVVGVVDSLDGGGRMIEVSLGTLGAVYGVANDVQLAVKARSAAARAPLARRVDALLRRDYPGLESLSNVELKKRTTDAINQQFAFFNA